MCFTDPPYNVAYEGGTADKLTIKNDSMSDAQFDEFLGQVYDVIYNSLRPGAPVYVCHADSYGHLFRSNFVQSGLLLLSFLSAIIARIVGNSCILLVVLGVETFFLLHIVFLLIRCISYIYFTYFITE